jgi:acetyl-CoA carboxylase carboxyl transferase subunit beta
MGADPAFSWSTGSIADRPVACGAFDFAYRGGSLGVRVADQIAAMLAAACQRKMAVLVTCSGGVRVEEGLPALLAMPRLCSLRQRLREQRIPLVAVATDPTMGGVAASLVAVADVIVAEPGARLGLSGPRAAAASGAAARGDSAESALAAGVLAAVVARADLPVTLAHLVRALVS